MELNGAKVFSKLNLQKGYFHIPLAEGSKDLTTTITPIGLRRYNRFPMGLMDAASAFQRRTQQALAGLPGVIVYIDDIVVFGKDQEEHDRNLPQVLHRLDLNEFRLQMEKCCFSVSSIPAFGHIVSAEGICPDGRKVSAIANVPAPSSIKEVQSFLGRINYYQDFMEGVAVKAEPLRALTRKDATFKWTQECEDSFVVLKQTLADSVQVRIFDPEAETLVTTDASDVGLGALLSQIQDGKEVPIAFYNKTLDSQMKRRPWPAS